MTARSARRSSRTCRGRDRLATAAGHGSAPDAVRGHASDSTGSVSLSWAAASDNVGVSRYNVHRSRPRASRPPPGTASRSRPPRATPTPSSPPAPTTTGSRPRTRPATSALLRRRRRRLSRPTAADRHDHGACGGSHRQRHGHGHGGRLGRHRGCGRSVPAGCRQPGERGHLVALFHRLEHDDCRQRQLLDHGRRPRQRRPDHHVDADHRHGQQCGADRRSGRGLRIQRGLGLDRS